MESIVSTHRPYQCKRCGKRLHTISALQQHTRIHRYSCPYQCSVCSKSFRLLIQLKSHQEIHDEKPFICSWCEKSFVEQCQLGHHLFRQHRVIANGLESQFPSLTNQDNSDPTEEKSEAESHHNNNNIIKVCESSEEENPELPATLIKTEEPPAIPSDEKSELLHVGNQTNVDLNVDTPDVCENAEEAASNMMTLSSELTGVLDGDSIGVDGASKIADTDEDLTISQANSISDIKTMVAESQDLGENFDNDFQDAKNVVFLPSQESVDLELGPPSDKQIRFLQSNIMANEEDSLTDGSLSDNTRFMLRGDPSLHRCQSGDDLFMFGSITFADDKDADSKSGDRPRLPEMGLAGSTWSSSNLASLVLPNTPHKLSVDPGASSVNVSPAMSPFRASIGQGESDSEESLDCKSIKTEKDLSLKTEDSGVDPLVTIGGVDKESSVSPGHTDSSAKLPIQPDSITFKKSPEASTFDDFEMSEKKTVGKRSKDRGQKKRQGKSTRKKARSNSERTEQKSKRQQRRRTKSTSSRRRSSTNIHSGEEDNDWTPAHESDAHESDPNDQCSKPRDKRVRTKKSQNEGEGDAGLEYNLRPKRRKTFQSLFHDGCECCLNSDGPSQKTFNVQHYTENVAKVEKLRKQVTELIGTVFPDLKFPPRFTDHGIAVEYLINEVTNAASERQRIKQTLVPFGPIDGEVKVVLCKYPLGCLRHTRRKISRLLSTLLPDINSKELEASGATVDDLLTQVIDTNRKTAVE